MKFSKSGRIVLALLVTSIVSLGITSCTSDYSIGYLYVTGTSANNTSGVSGEITGFKISNNTGALTPVAGSPFGSGGENPKRALVYSKTGRFLYVLNTGDATTGAGGGVALFFIGGAGSLTFQSLYTSQGTAPQTIVSDSTGAHLYVIDRYGPSTYADGFTPTPSPCVDSTGVAHPLGAVTVFTVDASTGRLSIITNNQVKDPTHNNSNLSYFPLGCFPIDAAVAQGNLYTIQQGTVATADLQSVFTYSALSSGQLVLTSNAVLPTNASNLTAISTDGATVYLLDAGPNPLSPSNLSYILPYQAGGTGGALTIASGGIVQNDPSVQNPVALLVEQGAHKFAYVANAGPDLSTVGNGSNSAISAFNIVNSQLSLFTAQEPIPTGSSPRCIVEDPSNQYIYTANHDSNNVTGHLLATKQGTLTPLRHASTSFSTGGNPTWCVVTGRLQ
ncbi:MAG TPA: beta-propeller fold lactonase family protein [Acidisarcina sp.]